MSKRLLPRPALMSLAALVVAAPALAGCSDDGDKGPGVTAAFYPLAWASEQVAGDRFTVTNLTQPGGEPHDLEVDVASTAKLAEADLVVFERGFQPAVDDAVYENADGATLDAADVLTLRPFADHDHDHDHESEDTHGEDDHGHEHSEDEHSDEHSEDGHDHDHGDTDPHFWQDPLLMADLGDAIADELGEIEPDHAEEFEKNAAKLRSRLEELDQEYQAGLANCARDTVVVSHDAFGYLSRYGLHFEPIAGVSPDAEPTPAELADLTDQVKAEGITTVFFESLVSPAHAETIAQEAGVKTAVLDPIEGLTDETSDDDYLSLMRQNLDALKKANDCTA